MSSPVIVNCSRSHTIDVIVCYERCIGFYPIQIRLMSGDYRLFGTVDENVQRERVNIVGTE